MKTVGEPNPAQAGHIVHVCALLCVCAPITHAEEVSAPLNRLPSLAPLHSTELHASFSCQRIFHRRIKKLHIELDKIWLLNINHDRESTSPPLPLSHIQYSCIDTQSLLVMASQNLISASSLQRCKEPCLGPGQSDMRNNFPLLVSVTVFVSGNVNCQEMRNL